MRASLLPIALIIAASQSFICAPAYAATLRHAVDVPAIGPARGAPIVFVDAMQQASPWTGSRDLSTGPDGELTSLPSGQAAYRLVFASGQWHPSGDYTLLYSGAGSLAVSGASVVASAPGHDVVRVFNTAAALSVEVRASSPNDPIRHVRLILPGFESSYATQPFYPPFVSSLTGADALRFASWSNAATLIASQNWTLRPRVGYATQASVQGVAPEYEIALANATGADPWFVLPMGATDAYVYGVADLARRFLDPRLHPMFEYGDRPWIAETPDNAYASMAAHNVGIGGSATVAPLGWYARRSAEIFAIVDRAYGADAARVTHIVSLPGAGTEDGYRLNAALRSFAPSLAGATPAFEGGGYAPHAAWIRETNSWTGVGMPERPYVRAIAGPMQIGDDSLPRDGIEVRPTALHPMAMISSGESAIEASGRASLAGALGDPLETVDLTEEGIDDWMAARAGGMPWIKRDGAGQIEVASLSGRLFRAPTSYSTFTARDAAAADGAPFSPEGLALAGDDASFSISAPASASERVLRVFAAAAGAPLDVTARVGGSGHSFAALVPVGASRDGVYTFAYRSPSNGRIVVTFRSRGEGVAVFRAATLRTQGETPVTPLYDEPTYHNDLRRSGWDPHETVLDTTNVASSNFGLLDTLSVDGSVLAQPLYVTHVNIGGTIHDVIIVVTEHDTVYEFDATTEALLQSASMGTSQNSMDVGCEDIRPEYGITSTPVVLAKSNTMYLVAATEPSKGVFQTWIHALDIRTLQDTMTPVQLQASEVISNGTKLSYDPQNQQTRTSLAWANDSLYVGVGSHCDNAAGSITGWELRYSSTLTQLAEFATSEDTTGYFLDSIWMTGFAPAVAGSGNLFVVTGNGAFDRNTGGHNYGETALELSPTLAKALDWFTPSIWAKLNSGDTDFGSGGIMLLPPQQATIKYVAVAEGKKSTIYLLNENRLGGVQTNDAGALQSIPKTGGGVWGGPAYYSGPTGEFVYYQSGGSPLTAYSVAPNSNDVPQLTLSSTGTSYADYGGSLPVVSSDGQMPGTAIVWLVKRSNPLMLEAYDALDVSDLLFSQAAGTWQNPQGNGFVTPLVAAGRVYVPASGTISVFGLGGSRTMAAQSSVAAAEEHDVFGTIVAVRDGTLALRLRDGRTLDIDIAAARARGHVGLLPIGRAVVVYGSIDRAGKFHATSVGHASQNPRDWTPDD